ncbi:MAG TPA: CDP-alcohol phosphatidyltransferase family protein [Blastocatellia bacterium]
MPKPVHTRSEDMIDSEFKTAARSQTGLLAPLERVCLNWLARHMPVWVVPDYLTLLGLVSMLAAGLFYTLARWWPASLLVVNLLLAVNWFGDSLDGTLARARNKQRPRYGFYVDHIVDAFGVLFLINGLALSGYMTWAVALALLVAYFMLSIDVYLATYTIGTFTLSFYKLSPTELRVLLAMGNVWAFAHPKAQLFGASYLFFDVSAVAAITFIAITLVISVARNTITLYRAERV